MNEKELFETVIKHQIVDDELIKRSARTETPQKKNALDRILTPVLTVFASLMVVFSVTMMIPQARAEVLSWFSPASARDYLSQDPEDREPVPELDAMITAQDLNHTEIKVNYCADEPYWREIGENFSATLGETVYNGTAIYISVDFDGLSGYAVYENEWGADIQPGEPLPTVLSEKVAPEMVHMFRDDNAGAEISAYLSGAREQWNGPDNFLFLTLEDGAQLSGWMEQAARPIDLAFQKAYLDEFGYPEHYTEESAKALRERGWEHVKTNGMRAVADVHVGDPEKCRFWPDNGKTLADYIDEDGYLTLHVNYQASIDHGEETEIKLDVDLGTVKVDMKTYKDVKRRYIEMPAEPIALSGEAVFNVGTFDDQNRFRVTNYTANLDGVTLRVTSPGVVDVFGVRDLKILVSMPDDWSEDMKYAFARNLTFDTVVDSDLLVNFGGTVERSDRGNYVLDLRIADTIPYNRIHSMQTITLTPTLSNLTEAQIFKVLPDGSQELIKTVPIAPDGFFDENSVERGTPVSYSGDRTVLNDFSITLNVSDEK
ncbi:MAG: hypothetical protein IKZ44_08175 [Clostridia bacterium]|nr:hypothetical protein [Clostridia bacterium]